MLFISECTLFGAVWSYFSILSAAQKMWQVHWGLRCTIRDAQTEWNDENSIMGYEVCVGRQIRVFSRSNESDAWDMRHIELSESRQRCHTAQQRHQYNKRLIWDLLRPAGGIIDLSRDNIYWELADWLAICVFAVDTKFQFDCISQWALNLLVVYWILHAILHKVHWFSETHTWNEKKNNMSNNLRKFLLWI